MTLQLPPVPMGLRLATQPVLVLSVQVAGRSTVADISERREHLLAVEDVLSLSKDVVRIVDPRCI
jgi:hypothetical protein